MYWAAVFLALTVATGLFAFGGVAVSAAAAGEVVFFACLLASFVALLSALARKRG